MKIFTVQSATQDSKETGARAEVNFATGLFQKYAADLATTTPVEGVVVIFDSADGGIAAATLSNVKQLADGSLSRGNFWKLCYLDPPEAF